MNKYRVTDWTAILVAWITLFLMALWTVGAAFGIYQAGVILMEIW